MQPVGIIGCGEIAGQPLRKVLAGDMGGAQLIKLQKAYTSAIADAAILNWKYDLVIDAYKWRSARARAGSILQNRIARVYLPWAC